MRAFLFILLFMSGFLCAEDIILAADPWPPYNTDIAITKDKLGFMVDIAKAIYEPLGYHIVYKNLPWIMALEDARNGKINGVIGANRSEVRDFIYPAEEGGLANSVIYARKGSGFVYQGYASLKGKKVGLIAGYSYGNELDKFFKDNPECSVRAVGDLPLQKNFTKLAKGELDCLIETDLVADYTLTAMELRDKFEKCAQIEGIDGRVYLAFSPVKNNSRALADIFSEGIKKLRASGKLKSIMAKYNLTDWK